MVDVSSPFVGGTDDSRARASRDAGWAPPCVPGDEPSAPAAPPEPEGEPGGATVEAEPTAEPQPTAEPATEAAESTAADQVEAPGEPQVAGEGAEAAEAGAEEFPDFLFGEDEPEEASATAAEATPPAAAAGAAEEAERAAPEEGTDLDELARALKAGPHGGQIQGLVRDLEGRPVDDLVSRAFAAGYRAREDEEEIDAG